MWKNLPLKEYVYTAAVMNIISLLAILISKSFIPPIVPLFYGLPAGINQLVPSYLLFITPITGLGISVLNISLARITKDLYFKKLLIISSSFASVLLAITTIKIILLVAFF